MKILTQRGPWELFLKRSAVLISISTALGKKQPRLAGGPKPSGENSRRNFAMSWGFLARIRKIILTGLRSPRPRRKALTRHGSGKRSRNGERRGLQRISNWETPFGMSF